MARKNFDLSDSTIQYLDELIRQRPEIRNQTQALEVIASEHKKVNGEFKEEFADEVIRKIDEKYGNALTRIRLGSTGADKNIQVALEILNTYLMVMPQQPKALMSTTIGKSPVIEAAELEVKNRISRFKQIKDNKRNRREK